MSHEELRVCVIGAGPAGLAAARNLKARGIPYDQLEKHSGVGGIWDITNPGTPMYESAHLISSRHTSGYYGFPMPDHFPDYPGHELVLDYTRQFTDAHDLAGAIQFDAPVRFVRQQGDAWEVTTEAGTAQVYSHVICASGHTWKPNWPEFGGRFDGEIMHAVDFRDPEIFKGKRVLVVGAGNSACDIACEAARSADAAFISMRRGYHFVPKHILGQPTDVFAAKSRHLPRPMRRWMFGQLLKHLVGDLTPYGLQAPDHRILESHPIINSQLIHYLQHGDIQAHQNIERFDGDEVVFVDGKREAMDLVVYATGYRYEIPYADPELFAWKGSKPSLDYAVFNPKHDTLFAAGFTEMNAGGYYIFDEMTSLIADAIDLQRKDPAGWLRAKRLIRQSIDFSGGIKFVQSERHDDYLDMDSYLAGCQRLSTALGWLPAKERLEALTMSSHQPWSTAA
ncbi:MAG: NAD(P)-binding domain-containing protein [Parvularculaceae bacterium]|nr:NAD(P)-binding domain-containing protein [Parvularculaceae bacterium]